MEALPQNEVKNGSGKDHQFWHEKMRFSTASQTLFKASVAGDVALATQAVRGLGDPNCCSSEGYRPLQVAIACGNQELVGLLLKASADINGHAAGTPPPLVLAAGSTEDKDGRLFESLLNLGADLNVAEDVSGETALTRAADRGHLVIVQIIMSRGSIGFQKHLAQRPRTGSRGDGATALHLSARRGHQAIVDRLLAVGSDPNHPDRTGRLALDHAVEGNHVEVANLLLTFGSAHSSRDKFGTSPLHVVAEKGFLTLADLLVRFAADVNIKDVVGRTPLHKAAAGGHDVVCQLLVAQGAEPNVADLQGETPFSAAFVQAHVRSCRVLLSSGAEVLPVGSRGWVPPYTEMAPEEHGRFQKGKAAAVEDFNAPFELTGC